MIELVLEEERKEKKRKIATWWAQLCLLLAGRLPKLSNFVELL